MPASLHGLSRLPDDVFVIDPVVHALNLDPANIASRYGEQLHQMSYGLHRLLTPPDRWVPERVYMVDMDPHTLVRTMFLETQTSLAATHTLTLGSWFRDGFAARWKTVEMPRAWPTRVLAYVGVDPCAGLETAMDSLEAQMTELPGAIGLKMYPHQIDPYRRWYANDDVVLRLIERAAALGIRTVAIHKALPNGSVPLDSYRIGEDFEQAADAFPAMTFEIIHSGMAFVEETAMAIGRYPNVYANLETTTAMLWQAPGRFEAALAQLMQWGGPGKILWSTGCTVTHPQHLLELFWAFRFGEATLERYGVPQLDEGMKRAILGGTYARAVGLDVADWRARQAGDAFAGRGELAAPWSVWSADARAAD